VLQSQRLPIREGDGGGPEEAMRYVTKLGAKLTHAYPIKKPDQEH
jgi:hypothetical protein